jgi:hypothetical protein
MRRSKNFAVFTGDPFTALCGKTVFGNMKRRISPRVSFHRFRRRYQSLLREEIAHTVATTADIDDELHHLIAVLRA